MAPGPPQPAEAACWWRAGSLSGDPPTASMIFGGLHRAIWPHQVNGRHGRPLSSGPGSRVSPGDGLFNTLAYRTLGPAIQTMAAQHGHQQLAGPPPTKRLAAAILFRSGPGSADHQPGSGGGPRCGGPTPTNPLGARESKRATALHSGLRERSASQRAAVCRRRARFPLRTDVGTGAGRRPGSPRSDAAVPGRLTQGDNRSLRKVN